MAIETTGEVKIAPRAGALARVSARLHSRRLDEALARGMPPEADAALALRARRLTARSHRRAAASGLRHVVHDTCPVAVPSRARTPPRRTQVIAASGELTRLADTLESLGPVAVRGAAQAWILLTDGTGPLYNADSPADLRARAASAANNLELES